MGLQPRVALIGASLLCLASCSAASPVLLPAKVATDPRTVGLAVPAKEVAHPKLAAGVAAPTAGSAAPSAASAPSAPVPLAPPPPFVGRAHTRNDAIWARLKGIDIAKNLPPSWASLGLPYLDDFSLYHGSLDGLAEPYEDLPRSGNRKSVYGHSHGSVGQAGKPPPGTLSADAIRHHVRLHLDAFENCYRKASKRKSRFHADLTVSLTVKEDGTVQGIGLESSPPVKASFTKCVRDVYLRIRFPKPHGGVASVKDVMGFSQGIPAGKRRRKPPAKKPTKKKSTKAP